MTDMLTLRRAFPRPVTYADLKAAYPVLRARYGAFLSTANSHVAHILGRGLIREYWHAALKEVTGAIDEVCTTTIDGNEVRVAVVTDGAAIEVDFSAPNLQSVVGDLLDAAERANYWQAPHPITIGKPAAATHEDPP